MHGFGFGEKKYISSIQLSIVDVTAREIVANRHQSLSLVLLRDIRQNAFFPSVECMEFSSTATGRFENAADKKQTFFYMNKTGTFFFLVQRFQYSLYFVSVVCLSNSNKKEVMHSMCVCIVQVQHLIADNGIKLHCKKA